MSKFATCWSTPAGTLEVSLRPAANVQFAPGLGSKAEAWAHYLPDDLARFIVAAEDLVKEKAVATERERCAGILEALVTVNLKAHDEQAAAELELARKRIMNPGGHQ